FADDLPVQFCIGRKRDVLLLYGRVHVYVWIARIVSVDADAFLEYQGDAFLPDTLAEVDQLACLAGKTRNKTPLPAEILVVVVLRPLFHDALIGNVADMLEHQQAHHQRDRFGRPAVIRAIKREKSVVKLYPVYLVG